MTNHTPGCRSCGCSSLHTFLTLGRTPLANSLLKAEQLSEPEPTYPLDLAFCPECSLVQLLESVPPEQLFRDYCYFSSFSDTMVRHAGDLARRLITERRLSPTSLVMEAASNDGYLLRHYQESGIPVLGIEPAHNVAKAARERLGIPTLEEFFTDSLAEQLVNDGQRATIFHGHNVLAHVPDLNGFVHGMRRVLDDTNGLVVIEVPYVEPLVENCEFDTIYHEHLWYFSLTALTRCFSRHDLTIADVELVPIHGGSLRIFAVPSRPSVVRHERVEQLLRREEEKGLTDGSYYRQFAGRVQALANSLRDRLHQLKREGYQLAGYGASAKGSTLLNFCGIGKDVLDYVVDRSSVKQGLYTPGTHLKIYHPDKLMEDRPDYVLLLTWNFMDEILSQQAAFRNSGGRFIVPVPEVRVA